MDLKAFFEEYKFIAPALLAVEMWPDIKYQKQKMNNKLKKHGGQRILPADAERAKEVLKKMAADIDKIK